MQDTIEKQQYCTSYYKQHRERILKGARQYNVGVREQVLRSMFIPTCLAPYLKINKCSMTLMVKDVKELIALWTMLAQCHDCYIKDGEFVAIDDNKTTK